MLHATCSVNDKVVVIPLSEEDDTCSRMTNFDIRNARCYDPNEEKKLLKVISAVGISRFNKKVRDLGQALFEKMESKSFIDSIKESSARLYHRLYNSNKSSD